MDLFHAFADMRRVVELRAYPVAVQSFRCLVGGASASERIEDDVSRTGRNQDGPFGYHRLQFVHARPDLEFRVAVGRGVRPEIRQIHPRGVHLVSMASIVPDFTAAVPAGLDRQAELVEYARRAAGMVEKGIVRRIELLPAWPGAFHGQRNPVPEVEPLSHDRSELHCKLRRGVEKERSARFQDTAALEDPPAAPGQVFGPCSCVVVAVLVVLADVERRIGEDGVDDLRLHAFEHPEAVGIVEDSMGGGQEWLHRPACLYIRCPAPGRGDGSGHGTPPGPAIQAERRALNDARVLEGRRPARSGPCRGTIRHGAPDGRIRCAQPRSRSRYSM